jgi:RHS repeat-associated protein
LPWGQELAQQKVAGYATPYRFTSKELDSETGLYYYGSRYYDPMIGQFFGVDPLASSFLGWSPYNYTLNNPINMIDPDGRAQDWIPDGKGNLIAEAGDNAQTLAKHMGTSYSHALGVLTSNGYTTTRKGNYDVLNLNVGDKVNAGGGVYSWSSSGTTSTISQPSNSNSNTASLSTTDKLGLASDIVGGMGTGMKVQDGSFRLTDGKAGNISLRHYQSGWQGGSRAGISTYKLGTFGTAAGRLGTFGTVGLGAYDVGSNAYSEGGFGTNTQRAAGRFGGSLGGGALGAAIGANFFGIGAIPGGIIGSVLFGAAGSKAGRRL